MMQEKCKYPDWEGNIISDKHVVGRDGYCCICGGKREMTLLPHYRGWVKREDYRKLERKVAELETKAEMLLNKAYSYELDYDGNRISWRALEADKDMIRMELEAENEMLIDAVEHCGYDVEDCIDCGGTGLAHDEYCRFWKLRHVLSFFEAGESDVA